MSKFGDRINNFVIKFNKNQQGMVLVFSLLVLILIAMWGAATLTLSTNEIHISNSSKKAIQAYYLAEAGLEEAIANLKTDPENIVNFSGSLETGTYTVEKSGNIPGTLIFTSTGRTHNDGFVKTLKAKVKVSRGSGGGLTGEAVYTTFGNKSTNVGGSTKIYGNLIHNGTIKFNGSTLIDGDIYCTEEFTIQGGSTITGDLYSKEDVKLNSTSVEGAIYTDGQVDHNWDSFISGRQLYNPPNPKYSAENNGGYAIYPFVSKEIPEFPEKYSEDDWYLPENGEGLILTPENGFITSLPTLPPGKSYYIVPNNSTLTGNINQPGAVIVSDGTINVDVRYNPDPDLWANFEGITIVADKLKLKAYDKITNCILYGKSQLNILHRDEGSKFADNNNVLLISNSNIDIPGSFEFQGGIISTAKVKVNGDSHVKGSIISEEIELNGSVILTFDRDTLQQINWPNLGDNYTIQLQDWYELYN